MPNAKDYGQINFRNQVIMLLPPILRSTTMVDWLHSLVTPLDTLLDTDWTFIYDQYIKGYLTGQKIVMQEGLNFLFKIESAPFILVETARDEGTTLYVYNEAELTTSFVYNEAELTDVYILNEAEATQPAGANIIVKIPNVYATTDNSNKLEQQVKLIKPAGVTYKIVTY